MNEKKQNEVILTETDFNLLKPYYNKQANPKHEMSLANELSRAKVVKDEAFPLYGIKLNSKVQLIDLDTQLTMEFTIVMPQYADIRQHKISILTPMGAALIGFRKDEFVEWKVPAGWKRFKILEVSNEK